MRRLVRHLLGLILYRTGLYRLLLPGRAWVVLFHRVDDRYEGNPISCGTALFERYCAFFARYFDVISATELLDLLDSDADVSGKLVITFDDGYEDNVAAAEIMRRHALSGCFFVATGFIGTDRTGWWDAERDRESHWMSWDDVRQLVSWGFEIGAHTQTHIDLGTATIEEALSEVTGSKQDLEREIGMDVSHFAYPYGRRECISEENLSVVMSAGYRTCMSAYGGVVSRETEPWDVQRVAVSPWFNSPEELGWALLREPRYAQNQLRRENPGSDGSEERRGHPFAVHGNAEEDGITR